jgi:hypothetical protein
VPGRQRGRGGRTRAAVRCGPLRLPPGKSGEAFAPLRADFAAVLTALARHQEGAGRLAKSGRVA